MNGPTRRAFLGGGLSIAAAVGLSGCRSAVGQASGGSSSSGPKTGGTLHLVQSTDILPNLLISQNNPNFSLCRTVFNTLIELDHRTLQPQPSLAASWTVSPDGLTYVFTLRDDVTFHSGRAFGPDDVVFVLKTLTEAATTSQVKAVAKAVTSATKTGDHEVTVVFGKRVSDVWDLFEMMIIVDSESYADLATGAKIIGTGPFKLDSYQPGSSISLKRNDKYWKPSRPYLDGVEIAIIGQSTSMVAALKSGQAQLALDLSPLDAAGLKGQTGFQLIESDAHDICYYIGANVKVAPLDKAPVRQAIAWAIDRERIVSQALGGLGTPSSLPWAPSSPAYDATLAGTYKMDTAKAKALLQQAGAGGTTLNLYYSNTLSTNAAVAQIVQANLAAAGLNVKLQPTQAAAYQKAFTAGKLEGLFVNGHGFGQLSPATLVKGAFPFNAQQNSSNFTDPQYTQLANAVWTGQGTQLTQAYAQLNKYLIDQQFVIDLAVSAHTYSITGALHGLAYTMYDYVNLDDAYLS